MNNKEELEQIDENKFEEVYNNTFYYKLHDQYPVSKSQWCRSFAFNKDGTRLAINYNQIIKVYELKKGDLKYLSSIFGHSFDVKCLKWVNNNNQIISCGHDRKILFWPINLTSNSKFILKLFMHQQPISCLIINSQEDLLISSSMDQTIQFFELNHQNYVWKCSQVLKEHNDIVLNKNNNQQNILMINLDDTIFSLSLSQNENQLITCGYDNLILVLQNSSQSSLKKCWIVKQKIFTDVYGYRLCFLTDYLFTFQPYNKEEMWIYDNRNSLDQFIKTKSVHVKSDCEDFASLFPHQFIPTKGILLAKNGNFIHLIKIQNSNDFQIQQSINYRDQCIFGQLSNDGDLLVTWDCKSNLIKVRKCVEQ